VSAVVPASILPTLLVKKTSICAKRTQMTIRIAAIEVSHWHALNDAAYLRRRLLPDLGAHGLGMSLHLTGERAQGTGAS
jgi:hypothetical protein